MKKTDYFNLKTYLKNMLKKRNVQIIETYYMDVILSLYSNEEKKTIKAYDLHTYKCDKFLVFLEDKHNLLLSTYYDMHIYAVNYVTLVKRCNKKLQEIKKEDDYYRTLEGSMAE